METPSLEDKSRLLPMEPLKRRECGQPLVSFAPLLNRSPPHTDTNTGIQ